ncbi:hypothetical protein PV08_04982 [Exophiala spinifera]|uniref:Ketoreductase (KR) domain-containing protein n=1 Tax=Exophiala spinifera TaxID=91928 RepID=A0A0D1ZYP1_9EURO|nr:uncharacterized protein PV08_04982 [Exophiala spinifera]KIW17787.1 hypothetical protein PV08_04982 [Exophiala spinifera]
MPSFGDFVHTQFVLKIPKPSASFTSKTVIITGGNSGLGKEAAKHIVRLGASKVILACRSQSRGKNAKQEIEALLKCSPDIIEVWELDLESPSSIKSFVERANDLPRLDVLINNAGIQTIKFKVVYDTERCLAVNVIGTLLLALQMIPKLKESTRTHGTTPHLTFVGSALYDAAKWPENHSDDIFAWFKEKSHMDPMNQYNLSKLLLMFAVIKLSAAVDPVETSETNPIVINTLDPFFCKTGLASELTGVIKVLFKIFEAIAARSSEEGSRLVVQAASAGRQTHGLYMRAGAVQEYAPVVQDDKRVSYVWDLLCKKLEKLQPGILQNIKS